VVGNNVTNNLWGIELWESSNNSIIANSIINNFFGGIDLFYSSGNSISENNITSNGRGIRLFGSSNYNIIWGNTIINNGYGIHLSESSHNVIYHNNFMNNSIQVYSYASTNIWDDSYPSGGNFWSNYAGVDVKSGPAQDLPGSDGIGDTPYIIDADNRDRYPLMYPYGTSPPSMYSLTIVATVGGTTDPVPGTYFYTANSEVQVTAIPTIDYDFDHWELDTINVGSANPYIVLMNNNHTLKAVFTYSPRPPLSVSISPPSASILMGQSVTFTSTVSGGYTPYNYQWYINGNPILGATTDVWTFTPTTTGNFRIYLTVTDSRGNIAKSNEAIVTVAPQLTVSIFPMNASILVGQSITFTSTVSGGYTPYTYQWFLNGNPVSGATSNNWTFMPTTSGIFYVYLKVTDARGNTAQSYAGRVVVSTVPVGGYSIPPQLSTKTDTVIPYTLLVTVLTATFIAVKRKYKKQFIPQ
jgi:parallel beta-helix repeat protein